MFSAFMPKVTILLWAIAFFCAQLENGEWIEARKGGFRGSGRATEILVDGTAVFFVFASILVAVLSFYDFGWKKTIGLVVVTYVGGFVWPPVADLISRVTGKIILWIAGTLLVYITAAILLTQFSWFGVLTHPSAALVAFFIWLAKSVLILVIFHFIVPTLADGWTQNSWYKLPTFIICATAAAAFMTWLHYVPFVIFFLMLSMTHHSLKVMTEPKFEQETMVIHRPVFYVSHYSYIVLACVLPWLLQVEVGSAAPGSPKTPVWKMLIERGQ